MKKSIYLETKIGSNKFKFHAINEFTVTENNSLKKIKMLL